MLGGSGGCGREEAVEATGARDAGQQACASRRLSREERTVLKRHPEGVKGLPGHVWLDIPGTVRSVGAHELEFTDDPPGR